MPRRTVSVIVPVKDGARHLGELLDAIARQDVDGLDTDVEILVIDSGSRDGSPEIARGHGARVIEIEPSEFGHGKTRNMAAQAAIGEVLVFLTQDATPAGTRWLARLLDPLDEQTRVGLSLGPHVPRPETSPIVARELGEFFGSFTDSAAVRLDETVEPGDPASGFFSNVNSAILRACWADIPFRDVAYAEDQAFARDAMARGWRKAFVPDAGVLHAHDYPFVSFMRRYFDEYRGLRHTVGHREPMGLRSTARTTLAGVRSDLRYMRELGWKPRRRLGWAARSARHHAGRSVFAPLGSRAHRLPPGVARRLSLEGSDESRGPAGFPRRPLGGESAHSYVRRYFCESPAPLATPSPHDGDKPLLHFAWVIPPFRRGSGGHMTIFTVIRELERKGHSNSIWIHDPINAMDRHAAVAHRELNEGFVELRAGVYRDLKEWHGADVAMATGWQTAYPLWTLPGCKLKSYFVQDHEPEFYGTSAEQLWAAETYRFGYPALAASPWLRDLVVERYGGRAQAFELGVDFEEYRPLPVQRQEATVVFYARPATPRRATELGLLALDELSRRRPGVRIVLFGDVNPPPAPFPHEFAGVLPARSLAQLYNEATVGLVISLTNYSRMPKEMMACGLPVVDVAHPSVRSVFGDSGDVIELAEANLLSLVDRMEVLLDDPARRASMSGAAHRFVQGMTWTAAAEQVEAACRGWLTERWERALEPGAIALAPAAGDDAPGGHS